MLSNILRREVPAPSEPPAPAPEPTKIALALTAMRDAETAERSVSARAQQFAGDLQQLELQHAARQAELVRTGTITTAAGEELAALVARIGMARQVQARLEGEREGALQQLRVAGQQLSDLRVRRQWLLETGIPSTQTALGARRHQEAELVRQLDARRMGVREAELMLIAARDELSQLGEG